MIPALLLKNRTMVKSKNFLYFVDTGNPITTAYIYNARLVDELIFINIEANCVKKSNIISIIEKVSKNIFIPFCVGGGINIFSIIRDYLRAGADKVSICTALVEFTDFIKDSIRIFGSQCIVAFIVYKQVDGELIVFTHSVIKKNICKS